MVSDSKLIEDLKNFSNKLNRTPTVQDMNKSGPWSVKPYINHFESWNSALEKAELNINQKKEDTSEEKLIKDLQEFAEKLGKTPIYEEMNNKGPWSAITYERRFESWNDALEAAGLDINREIQNLKSKEQLIQNLQQFAEKLGKIPTRKEMNDEGPWGSTTYERHFESWNGALKKAGLEINKEREVSKKKKNN